MSDTTVTGPVTTALDAQGDLEPGQDGWWRVWGATVQDIEDGDMIMVSLRRDDGSNEVREHVVTKIVDEGGIRGSVFLRFIDEHGADRSIGRMCPVMVVRRGTHNLLARSVR